MVYVLVKLAALGFFVTLFACLVVVQHARTKVGVKPEHEELLGVVYTSFRLCALLATRLWTNGKVAGGVIRGLVCGPNWKTKVLRSDLYPILCFNNRL